MRKWTLVSFSFALILLLTSCCVHGQDIYEPNNQLGDATGIDLNQSIRGSIFPAQDVDSYGFDLKSPGILKVSLESVPVDMRPRISLYGKNFNGITNKDASNAGDTVTLEIDVAEPGRYYIAVSDLNSKSYDVEYSFNVTFEPVADSMEPNNQLGDATGIDLNQSIRGSIFPAQDVDSYGFDLKSPGILKVSLESVPVDMRPRISLYGKNFNGITNKDASNAGDTVTLEIDVAEPGRYYIAVSDLNSKSYDVEYSFNVIPESMSDEKGKIEDATKQEGTKTSIDSTKTSISYLEANITHSGFDFSEGTAGEYPTYDGETINWQPDGATNPDYPRDSDYIWWRNTHLDDVNFASQTRDMGAVDISTIQTVPAEWDKSPLIPPLLLGHTIVARCNDGYVKFQVISIDSVEWTARVKYLYSADTTFDDTNS